MVGDVFDSDANAGKCFRNEWDAGREIGGVGESHSVISEVFVGGTGRGVYKAVVEDEEVDVDVFGYLAPRNGEGKAGSPAEKMGE